MLNSTPSEQLTTARSLLEASPDFAPVAMLLYHCHCAVESNKTSGPIDEAAARRLISAMSQLESSGPSYDVAAHLINNKISECTAGRAWMLARINRRLPLVSVGILLLAALIVSWTVKDLDPRLWFKTRFDNLVIMSSTQGYGQLGIGVDAEGKDVFVDGVRLAAVVGVHAPSRTTIRLNSSVAYLSGDCAYPDRYEIGEVVCQVIIGGRKVFESKTLSSKDRSEHFRLAVDEGNIVDLIFESRRADEDGAHGVWANLKGTP